jgi:hypothetical protein
MVKMRAFFTRSLAEAAKRQEEKLMTFAKRNIKTRVGRGKKDEFICGRKLPSSSSRNCETARGVISEFIAICAERVCEDRNEDRGLSA